MSVDVRGGGVPRPGPPRLQQQIHDRRGVAAGRHLLDLHDGAPPLQHGRQHPPAGEPQHLRQTQPGRIQTGMNDLLISQ